MLKRNGKEKMNNMFDWMMIQEINQGIVLPSHQKVKVLEVKPINFQLFSEREQVATLEMYRRILKQLPMAVQIVIVPFPSDVKEHLQEIEKYASDQEQLQQMGKEYQTFVKEVIGNQRSIVRRFFLLFRVDQKEEENTAAIIDGFNACGNEVTICDDETIRSLLKIYFPKGNMTEAMSRMEELCPTYLDTTNPRYLVMDDGYITSLLVHHYQPEMEGGFLQQLLSSEVPFILSMFYEKRNTYETLKELTGVIGNSGANLKTAGSNQFDIDLMRGSYENAKYMKKQLQVEDDTLFDLNLYVLLYADSVEELTNVTRKVESLLIGCGLGSRRGVFRQEEIFQACLPILQQSKELKNIGKRNVLASGLVSTYPFLSNVLCDKKGVLVGVNTFNHSVVMVDRFDSEKYKNANMCVMGASGSGKSYFMKLMITRNRLLNIEQYIVDPDREYTKICEALGGTLINFGEENSINVMEIRETMLEAGESYLQNKLQKLMTFFSILFPDLREEEKSSLEEKIIACYAQKGITFENESLYTGELKGKLVSKRIFQSKENMPILGDLYQIISKDKSMSRMAKLLKPYVSGAFQYMNQHTNVNLDNKLVVADIYHVEEKELPMVLFTITEFFWDKIQQNRGRKKMIYLDEVWKLIHQNEGTAEFVFKIFKTIRKFGGAATAITQDINDFFSLQGGNYGKGILSNSSMKCIFQMEENDIQKLKEVMHLSEMELYQLMNMERGTCLMHAGRNHLLVKIMASAYEHQFISTDRKDW